MPNPLKQLLTTLLLLLIVAPAGAQTLLANYTLNGTGADDTGNNGNLSITNGVFEQGGLYLNGIALPDTNWSDMTSPAIAGFNENSFTLRVEFRTPDLPVGQNRAILMGGILWRWIGMEVHPSGELRFLYNNNIAVATGVTIAVDTWYDLAMTYDGVTARAYLDGVEIVSKDYALVFGDDATISSTNGGNGTRFKGWLKNLRVMEGLDTTVPVEERTWGGVKSLYR